MKFEAKKSEDLAELPFYLFYEKGENPGSRGRMIVDDGPPDGPTCPVIIFLTFKTEKGWVFMHSFDILKKHTLKCVKETFKRHYIENDPTIRPSDSSLHKTKKKEPEQEGEPRKPWKVVMYVEEGDEPRTGIISSISKVEADKSERMVEVDLSIKNKMTLGQLIRDINEVVALGANDETVVGFLSPQRKDNEKAEVSAVK